MKGHSSCALQLPHACVRLLRTEHHTKVTGGVGVMGRACRVLGASWPCSQMSPPSCPHQAEPELQLHQDPEALESYFLHSASFFTPDGGALFQNSRDLTCYSPLRACHKLTLSVPAAEPSVIELAGSHDPSRQTVCPTAWSICDPSPALGPSQRCQPSMSLAKMSCSRICQV